MFHVKHGAALIALASLLTSSQASAQESRLYAAGGGDVWRGGGAGGHGYALLNYQRDGVWRGGMLDVTYNTDTLWAAIDGVRLTDNVIAGAMLKGQLGFAGLLPDYYVQGVRDASRGFDASYGQGRAWVKAMQAPHYFEVELGARRWSFAANDATSASLVLPAVGWVFEPRMRYTLWMLGDDAAIREPHRHTWRLRGLALGAEGGLDVRDAYAAFGSPEETRNHARRAPLYGLVWLRAGRQLTDRVRVQTAQVVMAGSELDDLNRWRIGGMNPYVAPVAGMPWASYLSSNFWSAEVEAAVRVAGDHEVGAVFHAVRFSSDDALRRGDGQGFSLDSGVYGAGLMGDLRFGPWQIDARAGVALPSDVLLDKMYMEGWLSVGYRAF